MCKPARQASPFRRWPLRLIVACVVGLGAPGMARADDGQAAGGTTAQAPWWERIRFGGDFRSRFETTLQDEEVSRYRLRMRLRLTVSAPINDEVSFATRLSTGEATDITTRNQTLGRFFTLKPLGVDQAFMRYAPKALKGATFTAGKFDIPFSHTQMTWDDEVNWEGLAEQFEWQVSEGSALGFAAVQTPLNEVTSGSDAFMLAEFAEGRWERGVHDVSVSVAHYRFLRADQIAVGFDAGGLRNPLTNLLTRDADGRVTGFASDYSLINLMGQWTLTTPREHYPLSVVVDWVKNTRAAIDDDTGFWVGVAYGTASVPGSVSLDYTFLRIEQDAVISGFNYSDITPTANVIGNVVALSYMALPRLNLDVTGYFTEGLTPRDGLPLVTRVQIDVRVRF